MIDASRAMVRHGDDSLVAGASEPAPLDGAKTYLVLAEPDTTGAMLSLALAWAYDGRAALWHHESSTRNLEERESRLARTIANRDLFVGRWAPRAYRSVLADAMGDRHFWSAESFRLGTVGISGPIDGVAGRDWTVHAVEPGRISLEERLLDILRAGGDHR